MATEKEVIDPSLQSIANEAAADPALQAPAGPQVDESGNVIEQPAPVDYAREATEIIEIAFSGFSPLYPTLEKIYTPEVRAKIAQRAAPLMEKYGFTVGGLLEKWGAEVMFAVTVVPLIAPTVKAIAADNKAAREAAGETVEKTVQKDGLQPIVDTTDQTSLHTRI